MRLGIWLGSRLEPILVLAAVLLQLQPMVDRQSRLPLPVLEAGALSHRAERGTSSRRQKNIVDQPRAAHKRRNGHQGAAGNVLDRIQRVRVDDLEIVETH